MNKRFNISIWSRCCAVLVLLMTSSGFGQTESEAAKESGVINVAYSELSGMPKDSESVEEVASIKTSWKVLDTSQSELESPIAVSFQDDAVQLTSHSRKPNNSSLWYAGTDVLYSKAFHSNGSFAVDETDGSISFRPYFGCEAPNGIGVRARAWFYSGDNKAYAPATDLAFNLRTDATTIDVDMYKRFSIRDTEIALGIGSRTGILKIEFPNLDKERKSGSGISAFSEGYYMLSQSWAGDYGVMGSLRMSYLAGTTETDLSSVYSKFPGGMTIGEAMMGIQLRRHLPTVDLVVQLKTEVQTWHLVGFSDFTFTSIGGTFGVDW